MSLDKDRDIYSKPDVSAKKQEETPRPDYMFRPAEARAKTIRTTALLTVVMLVVLGLAAWFVALQEERSQRPEEGDYEPPIITPRPAPRPDDTRRQVELPVEALAPVQPSDVVAPDIAPDLLVEAHNEVRMAQQYLRTGDLESAERHLRRALNIWPEMNVAKRLLGFVYVQRSQPDQAISILREALGHDPLDAETYNTLASAYMQKGLFTQAEDLLFMSMKLRPDYMYAYLNLGLLYLATQRYEAAAEYLERGVEALPLLPSPRNNLAVALMRVGRYQESRDHLQHLIDQQPTTPAWYFNMAITFTLEQQFGEALEWIRRGAAHCSPVAFQRFMADEEFNELRRLPEFREMLRTLYPELPALPGG